MPIMPLKKSRLVGHYQVLIRLADTRGSAELGQLDCMYIRWSAWFSKHAYALDDGSAW